MDRCKHCGSFLDEADRNSLEPRSCARCRELVQSVNPSDSDGPFHVNEDDLYDGNRLRFDQCRDCGSAEYEVVKSASGELYIESVEDEQFLETGSEACHNRFRVTWRPSYSVVF